MDEITLVNLLNKICEKNPSLTWQLNCKYTDGMEHSIMEVGLFDPDVNTKAGFVSFQMETGKVIKGKHKGMVPFPSRINMVDALLEILHYESKKLREALN